MQKNTTLLFVLFCVFATALSAQTSGFFQPVAEGSVELRGHVMKRDFFPTKYDTYRLDYAGITAVLQNAPEEFSAAARQKTCVVSIPMTDGSTEAFAVWKTAIMDPELAAQFPEIGTLAGRSLSNPARTVRIVYSGRGFRAMVLQPDLGVAYVEPYAWGQGEYCIAYNRADLPPEDLSKYGDHVPGDGTVGEPAPVDMYAPPAEDRGTLIDPVKLKVFRYAAACTGEFGEDHGGTKPLALAAVVDYTDRIDAIYERDANIRLQLIPNTQYVIFTNPGSDPYSGTTVDEWLSQNTDVLNQYCNFNAYDIGHVYARYLGGNNNLGIGGLGVVCGNSKGGGCTSGNGNGDYGDKFVNTLGQEVGHQLNGGHTWNSCSGIAGRTGNSAFEPGSGSTIMSYAGSCGPDNVQSSKDLYFHSGSIEEFTQFYTTGTGATCGTSITTDNNPPVVTLPYQDNFFIPIQTPFEMNGSATDPDGDTLSYVWEGIDAGPETPLGTEIANSAIFRTYPSGTATNRYFPRLSNILNNFPYNAELLPEYTRDVTLRLTARDNRPGGGGVGWADVAFKAWSAAGPFLVTSPNTVSDVWHAGEYVEVTWDVANTDVAPVNCKNVNIRLSTDGGLTYPVTLASGVPNDGSFYVLVPNILTSKARVRIDAAENVFFDLSNANFKIQQPTQPALTMGLALDAAQECLPNEFATEVFSAGSAGFNAPVSLALTGNLPPGAVATFSKPTINPGESSTLQIDMKDVSLEGIYTFNVEATAAGSPTLVRPVTLTLVSNDFSALALQSPADGATNLALVQTLHWNASPDANTYDVQFSNSPSFATILASKTDAPIDSFKIPFLLEKGKAYYWRVRPRNECGIHDWTEPHFFATYPESCKVYTSNDLPKNITSNGTPTIESKITVNGGGTISDINIRQIKGYHEFFKDVEAHLISPQGTDVTLFKDKCGNFNGFFNFGLDDDAPGAFPCPPANNAQFYRPQNPLAPFYGQDNTGTWTFRVKDNVIGGGGTFEIFSLEFCATVAIDPPFLVNNNALVLTAGTNQLITPDLLLAEDGNNTHDQLIYTLVTVPQNGFLERSGFGALHSGDQFRQANIDAGNIRFFDYGSSAKEDGFRFTVTDGEGGFLGTPKFIIQPQGVGTHEISGNQALTFNLFPNPAGDFVWLTVDRQAQTTMLVSVFNAAGQMVKTTTLLPGAERLQINTAGLPKGMYAVRLQSESGTGVKKLVLK